MKMYRSKLSAAVGVIAVAGVLTVLTAQTALAQAQVIHQKFDESLDVIDFAATNPCLTEDVHTFGTLTTHIYTVVDAKGGLHLKIHVVANLESVGLSTGDTYHTQGPLVVVVYDFDNDPNTPDREIFFHNLIQLVGPGQDGKFLLRQLFHLVVNANGVQTLLVEKNELLCEGGGKG
jgi:hypothetical protein